MENNKPRKISFTILAFLYIFLHILKLCWKKKKKKIKGNWAGFSPAAQVQRESAPARPAPWRFCRTTPASLSNSERALSLFLCVADRSQKGPCVSINLQPEVPDGARAPPRSGELADWPIGAVTDTKL